MTEKTENNLEKNELVIGVTGHRELADKEENIKKKIKEQFAKLKPTKVVTGMALGFDMLVAEVCVEENIPFIAACPFYGQENLWSDSEKEKYKLLLSKAYEIKYVLEREYQTNKDYHTRNRWLVDNCHKIICYLKPKQKSGGTFQACKYAKIKNKEVVFNAY